MRDLEILAVATLALGVAHIFQYVARRHSRREQKTALQTWEQEGGAVPVARNQTTATQLKSA